MKENRSYNILHLTDLHIGPGGRSEVYTDRTGGLGEGEIKLAPEDAFDSFITRLQREITQGRVFKPDAILITGDLINKREIPRLKHSDKSSSADIEKQEKLIEKAIVDSFGHARMCIQKLQDALNVHDKKVMIVPGNHDVTWGRNKKFQDRFSSLLKIA